MPAEPRQNAENMTDMMFHTRINVRRLTSNRCGAIMDVLWTFGADHLPKVRIFSQNCARFVKLLLSDTSKSAIQ